MVLWELKIGQGAEVERVEDNLPVHYRNRLCDLGFRPGLRVTCLRWTPFGGPRIYQIGDSVFSLASDVARSVTLRGGDR